MIEPNRVLEFVTPYYKDKDIMHDLSHIKRVDAKLLMKFYPAVDQEVIYLACYFHGFNYKNEDMMLTL